MTTYNLPDLPLPNIQQWETVAVLKKAAIAHRYLAELKGLAASVPNEAILINTLSLQEAKGSSEIENIITTHDELYKADLNEIGRLNPAAKEVQNYAFALRQGFEQVRQNKIIRLTDILSIQQMLEKNNAGFRKLAGTTLKNARTQQVVYTPPQHPDDIIGLMRNLEAYINDNELCSADPLVKMAIIHHQFESIHPFYDGNGRTGRILNILYLVTQDLLNLPILYLSRYFIRDKAAYYQELQAVRNTQQWEPWLLYLLEGVIQTAQETITLLAEIKALVQKTKHQIRSELPKIYRQELLNNLFKHPYTKIDFVIEELGVSRVTATKYLELLVEQNILSKQKIGRSNYYINEPLVALLMLHS